MSGCFPDVEVKDWTICGHCNMKVPVNGDHLCEMIQQLKSSINSALSANQQEYKNLSERLDERVQNLEDRVQGISVCVCRLENEPNSISGQLEGLSEHIEKLHEMQNAMLTMPNVVWQKYHKTPYKCPLCDGKGTRKLEFGEPSWPLGITPNCKSCEGKGIVCYLEHTEYHDKLAARIEKLEGLYEFILGHKLGEKNLANRVQDLETTYYKFNEDLINIEVEVDNKNKSVDELKERIEKLEGITDFKKLEACIFNGAQTHLSILKCESEIKKLRNDGLKPHRCPLCDGLGGTKISGTIDEECHACEGKGIVWG
ncbi:MAG TPA: hypothetical protein VNX68_01405 [Nitrosopumilaceae archaeon]|jgi:hypothetical protein|nr:hypothetical protein [Nitrosopumilaceae archaeon]